MSQRRPHAGGQAADQVSEVGSLLRIERFIEILDVLVIHLMPAVRRKPVHGNAIALAVQGQRDDGGRLFLGLEHGGKAAGHEAFGGHRQVHQQHNGRGTAPPAMAPEDATIGRQAGAQIDDVAHHGIQIELVAFGQTREADRAVRRALQAQDAGAWPGDSPRRGAALARSRAFDHRRPILAHRLEAMVPFRVRGAAAQIDVGVAQVGRQLVLRAQFEVLAHHRLQLILGQHGVQVPQQGVVVAVGGLHAVVARHAQAHLLDVDRELARNMVKCRDALKVSRGSFFKQTPAFDDPGVRILISRVVKCACQPRCKSGELEAGALAGCDVKGSPQCAKAWKLVPHQPLDTRVLDQRHHRQHHRQSVARRAPQRRMAQMRSGMCDGREIERVPLLHRDAGQAPWKADQIVADGNRRWCKFRGLRFVQVEAMLPETETTEVVQ